MLTIRKQKKNKRKKDKFSDTSLTPPYHVSGHLACQKYSNNRNIEGPLTSVYESESSACGLIFIPVFILISSELIHPK